MSKKHRKHRPERPVQTPEEQQEAIDHLFKAIEAEHPVQEPEPFKEPEPVRPIEVEVVVQPKVLVKTTITVNFRHEPSKEASIIFKASPGTSFKLIGEQGEWSNLEFSDGEKGVIGWIMTQYLVKER